MCFKNIFSKSVLVVAFLIASIGFFNVNAPSAQAITADELQAQIQALLAQIIQLQKQLTEITGEPAVWCYDFDRNLKFGNHGSEVKALQIALEKEGFTEAKNDSSGNFGIYTSSAVVGFQEKYASDILASWGLKRGTGYVGTTTRAKLNEIYGCGIVPPIEPEIPPVESEEPEKEITTISPDVFVISDNGTMISENNDVDVLAVTKEFFKTQEDKYDFISIFTAFDNNQSQSHWLVLNNVEGIGFNIQDNSNIYGSKGKLKGANFMTEIDMYDLGETTFNGLKHETGHQWLASVGGKCGSIVEPKILYRWGIHWGFYLDTRSDNLGKYKDPMGGNVWIDNQDGTFKTAEYETEMNIEHRFCPLSLYLMGLIPQEEVSDFTLIEPDNGDLCDSLSPIKGKSKKISIDEIISLEGGRSPSWSDAQKDFTMAFILIVQEKKTATEEQIDKIKYITNHFPEKWAKATDYKSTINKKEEKSITVLSPNGGEQWVIGNTYEIKWESSFKSTEHVRIFLKEKGGGVTSSDVIAWFQSANGFYAWKINETGAGAGIKIQPGEYKIRICELKEKEEIGICDESDSYFSIVEKLCGDVNCDGVVSNTDRELLLNYVSYPDQYTICSEWAADVTCDGNIDMSDVTLLLNHITYPENDRYTLRCCEDMPCTDTDGGKDYYVKGTINGALPDGTPVTKIDTCSGTNVLEYFCLSENNLDYFPGALSVETYACPYGCSDGACIKYLLGTVTVISPNGGEQWVIGGTYDITWNSTEMKSTDTIAISLSKNDVWYKYVISNVTNSGTYSWTIPSDIPMGDYKIEINGSPSGYSTAIDSSDNYFSIVKKLCGDVNCDGVVSNIDRDLLLNYVSYPGQYTICSEWAADVTCDGNIDMGDVVLLLNHITYPENNRYTLRCCEGLGLKSIENQLASVSTGLTRFFG